MGGTLWSCYYGCDLDLTSVTVNGHFDAIHIGLTA